MPRSYRSIILAAVAWLILANAGQYKNQQGQKGQTQRAAQQGVAAAPVIKPSATATDTKTTEAQCLDQSGGKRECASASAQATIDQARYTYWQAIAAIVGMVVGAGTLAAAFMAAVWARKAAIHTKRNADAAHEANRPIMVFDRPQLHRFSTHDILVSPFWKNIGSLPAKPISLRTYRTYVVGNPGHDQIVDLLSTQEPQLGTNLSIIKSDGEREGAGRMMATEGIGLVDRYRGQQPSAAVRAMEEATGVGRFAAGKYVLFVFQITYGPAIGDSGTTWESEQVLGLVPLFDNDRIIRSDSFRIALPANYPEQKMT